MKKFSLTKAFVSAATLGVVALHTAFAQPATAAEPGKGLSARFTLASTAPMQKARQTAYPALFGTREVKYQDISVFSKWTNVMRRFDRQMQDSSVVAKPAVSAWLAEIERLRGLSEREQINGVNAFLNKIEYIEDVDNYGKTDYWATPVEFLTRGGDCEDFAIAKYASLRALGFSEDQLRIAIVQDEIKKVPHALLVVYADSGSFVLDNQDKNVETIASVNRYRPIFSINAANWWLHKA